jgi:hypothetical protein
MDAGCSASPRSAFARPRHGSQTLPQDKTIDFSFSQKVRRTSRWPERGDSAFRGQHSLSRGRIIEEPSRLASSAPTEASPDVPDRPAIRLRGRAGCPACRTPTPSAWWHRTAPAPRPCRDWDGSRAARAPTSNAWSPKSASVRSAEPVQKCIGLLLVQAGSDEQHPRLTNGQV